jgi:transposase
MGSASDRAMHQYRHEGDAYRRIELITGERRRRRWSVEEKAALVAESLRPGVNVSALARRHGVNRGLLQTWRRAATRATADDVMTFIPLRLDGPPVPQRSDAPPRDAPADVPGGSTVASGPGMIEIESGGVRVRFSGPVDVAALRVVLGRVGRGA